MHKTETAWWTVVLPWLSLEVKISVGSLILSASLILSRLRTPTLNISTNSLSKYRKCLKFRDFTNFSWLSFLKCPDAPLLCCYHKNVFTTFIGIFERFFKFFTLHQNFLNLFISIVIHSFKQLGIMLHWSSHFVLEFWLSSLEALYSLHRVTNQL